MEKPAPSALVVGAVSRDTIADSDPSARPNASNARVRGPVPGGVVFHAGLALARLGARVRVATRVAAADADVLLAPLEAERVETLALPSAATTSYALDYRGRVDAHELESASDPLRAADLPRAWRSADLVQLGPLHPRDLAPDVPGALSGLVGLDLQGLLRGSAALGLRAATAEALAPFLASVDVVQASEQELPTVLDGGSAEAFAKRHGLRELIVTRGARGALVITPGRSVDVAATPAHGHATIGAGDVFLATYLLLRVQGYDPERAARGAGRATTRKIDHGLIPKGLRAEELCG